MAIYHFSAQVISRSNNRNAVKCAAYRSGERLYDERNRVAYEYKRAVQPETFILAPPHCPDWAYDREHLWNEVESVERQWNAQLAREMNVALPRELSREQQRELTREFVQDVFVNEGMVADVAIHRDDENNPHFHMMLTMRPFDENGQWGKKQIKVDGKPVHVTDWNQREKLYVWRKAWADYANRYLEKYGFVDRISHLSNKDRSVESIPTVHEGFVAKKIEKQGKISDLCERNRNIKKHNEKIQLLNEYKERKSRREKTSVFVRSFTPSEKKALKDNAKYLRMFVDPKKIEERKLQLSRWEKSLRFSKNEDKREKSFARIQDERDRLEELNSIFEREAERFIKKYYGNSMDHLNLSAEQKVWVVDETINQNELIRAESISELIQDRELQELEKEIGILYNNRFTVYSDLKTKIQSCTDQFAKLADEIDFGDPESIRQAPPHVLNQIRNVLVEKQSLMELQKAIERMYDIKIQQLYPQAEANQYLDVHGKEGLIMFTEYMKRSLSVDDLKNKPDRFTVEEQKIILEAIATHKPLPDVARDIDNTSSLYMFLKETKRNQGSYDESTTNHVATLEQRMEHSSIHQVQQSLAGDIFDTIFQAIVAAQKQFNREQELQQKKKQKRHHHEMER